MQRAAALPLEIAEAASDVAAVAAVVAERCDGLVRADAAGAAALAAGRRPPPPTWLART